VWSLFIISASASSPASSGSPLTHVLLEAAPLVEAEARPAQGQQAHALDLGGDPPVETHFRGPVRLVAIVTKRGRESTKKNSDGDRGRFG